MITRGDIRWFRFEAPDKRRPVLVLGREDVLPSLAQIPVIPLSTNFIRLRRRLRHQETDADYQCPGHDPDHSFPPGRPPLCTLRFALTARFAAVATARSRL